MWCRTVKERGKKRCLIDFGGAKTAFCLLETVDEPQHCPALPRPTACITAVVSEPQVHSLEKIRGQT